MLFCACAVALFIGLFMHLKHSTIEGEMESNCFLNGLDIVCGAYTVDNFNENNPHSIKSSLRLVYGGAVQIREMASLCYKLFLVYYTKIAILDYYLVLVKIILQTIQN